MGDCGTERRMWREGENEGGERDNVEKEDCGEGREGKKEGRERNAREPRTSMVGKGERENKRVKKEQENLEKTNIRRKAE